MRLRTLLACATSLAAVSTGMAHAQAGATSVQEVIVTGIPLGRSASEVASNVAILAGDELVHRRQATLGETLTSLPGVNSDTFGGGASRPVIRGQTAPRVKVLSDGASLMDASEISPDHAISVEPLLMDGIEILRGPSALLYGGGAIGGAVNVIDRRVPMRMPTNGLQAVGELRGGTADDERAGVLGVDAGLGQFAIHGDLAVRRSDDYKVPDFEDGVVHGSYNRSKSYSVGASWIGSKGYLGAAYTRQDSDYGLPGHNHEYESCHPHGSTLHCGGHDDHDHEHEDHGHGDDVPSVDLKSTRIDVRGEVREPLPLIERVRMRVGVTDYRHDEIDEGVIGTTFTNEGYDGRVEVEHVRLGGWRGVVGFQTSKTDFAALGEEAFLPETKTSNVAVFGLEEYELGDLRFELAARHEWQTIKAPAGVEIEHKPFSLSGAAIWNFAPDWSASLTLARSQRAPVSQELFARGVHLATNTYEIGAPTLKVETAKSAELTLRKTKGDTTFSASAYRYNYDGYIHALTLDRFEDFRLIRYSQGDAKFTGLEGEVEHRFSDWLSGSLFGDYVRATVDDTDRNVPRIPAARLGARTDFDHASWSVHLEYFRVFEQDKIAAFETATAGYNMANMTVSYDLPAGRTKTQIFLRGSNLLDELALNHASFLTNAAPLRGRNFVLGLRASF